MLDECLAQLARGLNPVSIRWQKHAARADAVDLGIVHAWRNGAVLHVRLDGGDQATANANDHGIGGAQVLLGAIVDATHGGGHRGVLHADARDAGVAVVARVATLRLSIDPRLLAALESVAIPLAALAVALLLFGVFIALCRVDPLAAYALMYKGAFGSWFSWQNSLVRAAPLILTALCTALPAQLGLVVIGGEGALVIGGLAAVAAALSMQSAPPLAVQLVMAAAGT